MKLRINVCLHVICKNVRETPISSIQDCDARKKKKFGKWPHYPNDMNYEHETCHNMSTRISCAKIGFNLFIGKFKTEAAAVLKIDNWLQFQKGSTLYTIEMLILLYPSAFCM
jgi:hypothetical protein